MYLSSDKTQRVIDLKEEYKFFSFDKSLNFFNTLKHYLSYSEHFEREDFNWRERVSFADFKVADFSIVKNILVDIPTFLNELSVKLRKASGRTLGHIELEEIISKKSFFEDLDKSLKENGIFEVFKSLNGVDGESSSWLERVGARLLKFFDDEGPEISVRKDKLGQLQEALIKAESAVSSTFGKLQWSWFSKDKKWINKILSDNGLKLNKKGIEILARKLDNRLNLEHNLSELSEMSWLSNFPDDRQKIFYQGWFYKYKQAFILRKKIENLSQFISVDIETINSDELSQKISELLLAGDLFLAKRKDWLRFVSQKQLERILFQPEYAFDLATTLDRYFDSLCEYDQLYKDFHPVEAVVVSKLLAMGDHKSSEELLSIFENSLKLAWIDHIEQVYPILRSASTLKLRQLEEDLQAMVQEKLRLSKDILLLKLRERTYKNIEVNRLNNLITYRDLSHQVTKRRMIWPIRKLISTHAEEIFNLVPCWLASPESVSAMFPMEVYFDLVIFDEASQCFAENGIPSIYRGRQVVITGDSKQLNPNDIYRSRWDEQDDEIPETQIDSLLELGSRYLMQTQLTGHYRSRTLELINFSNHYFYKGKLNLIPHFSDINQSSPSIDYVKVDGIWENNTNEVEAIKLVELVLNLVKRGVEEIGVVTFNFVQQMLVQNILESESASQGVNIPEALFIKNIENVQGDERDVIIFSIGYAPDLHGKLSMNFGTLNVQGGENRLNVAITRAKKKIIVITSIYPDQLKVEDLKHDGPKYFKKYLEYALDISEGRHSHQWKSEAQLPFEGILKHKLVGWLPTDTEKIRKNLLPFSDLVVTEGNDFKGLILTDDDLYYQGISIKDSHVYKKITLSNKGWKFKDFYSREYWNDKDSMNLDYLEFRKRLE